MRRDVHSGVLAIGCIWCSLILLPSGGSAQTAEIRSPLLLRDPTLSRSEIAFSYAGDIWVAKRDGTHLHRVTSSGRASRPAFSPDGTSLAFVDDSEGSKAVYTVLTSGGARQRLTYHPADLGAVVLADWVGWSADGKRVLLNSRRTAVAFYGSPFPLASQLFTVPATGGAVSVVPLATASEGAFSPDGRFMAYVPTFRRQPAWKGYRGGGTTSIWIARLADSSLVARVPRQNSNDFNPMWLGDTVYFLSDRDGPVTLFAYDVHSNQVRKIVRNDGLDIHSASASPGAIAYEQFGSLHILDLKSGHDRALDIRPMGEFPEVRPRWAQLPPDQLLLADLSPSGDRAVFSARGHIITASTDSGSAQISDLTLTPAIGARDPAWSPDGRSIAYFSDESGAYALYIRHLTGLGSVHRVNLGDPAGFYYAPSWSPDSTKVAFTDQRLNYWYVDLHDNVPVRIDTDLYVDPENRVLTWSTDGRWIAYTRQMRNHLHAAFLYSLADARTYQLTDGLTDVRHVTFDSDGQHLYFTSSTDLGLTVGWLEMSGVGRPLTRTVYVIPIADAISGRIGAAVALPIPGRNYLALTAGPSGSLFLFEGPRIHSRPGWDPGDNILTTEVYRFDRSTGGLRRMPFDVTFFAGVLGYVSSFHLAAGRQTALYSDRGQWHVASIDPSASANTAPGIRLNLQALKIYVDPYAEWRHMYDQVWRDLQGFFYDPKLHGLDFDQVKQQYQPYLNGLVTRADLNVLFREMLSNLSVGHVWAAGGDIPKPKENHTGLLGADFAVEKGRYRFTRIYSSDLSTPGMRAPLAQTNARPGEYLLAVNGRDARSTADLYRYLENTAGKKVVLTIGPRPDTRESRTVTVEPLSDEGELRHRALLEDNRRTVDALSGGRVAYVCFDDTAARAAASFNRDYVAQIGKEAVIVDARYNSGGDIADFLIDYLRRPVRNYWHTPYGHDLEEPQEAIAGTHELLVNEMTGSGGDWLAWAFREAGIGPIIGRRTWGGLVGYYTTPDDLLDGGQLVIPNLAFYDTHGQWTIENHGVAPDIEVEQDPQQVRAGHDPQLEKAVAVVMRRLQDSPPPAPPHHPPFPRSGTVP